MEVQCYFRLEAIIECEAHNFTVEIGSETLMRQTHIGSELISDFRGRMKLLGFPCRAETRVIAIAGFSI